MLLVRRFIMLFIIQPMIQVKLIGIRAASSHRRAATPVNKKFVAQVARISNKEPRKGGFIVGCQVDGPTIPPNVLARAARVKRAESRAQKCGLA